MALRSAYPESTDREVLLVEWSYFDMFNYNNRKLGRYFSVRWSRTRGKLRSWPWGKIKR